MNTLVGVLIGGTAGFALGVVGWLAFFYLVFMLPKGTEFQYIDQGAIPTVLTGPLGAIIGGVIGGFVFRTRLRPTVPKRAAAEPGAAPNGGPVAPSGDSKAMESRHQ